MAVATHISPPCGYAWRPARLNLSIASVTDNENKGLMMNRVKAALSVIDVDGSMQPLKLVEAMSPVTCETTVAETAVHFARIAVAGTAYKVIGRAGGGFDSDIRAVVGAEDQGDLANLSVTALTQVRQDLV